MTIALFMLCMLLSGSAEAAPVMAEAASAEAAYAEPSQDIDRILDLIVQRRALMREVAAWKWLEQKPIEDPEREHELLDRMRAQGRTLGIDPEALADFFKLQMRWARREQRQAFAQWQKDPQSVVARRDLATELRPELDRIGIELVRALYVSLPELSAADFTDRYQARIEQRSQMSKTDARALIDVLANLKRIEVPTLARIRASGLLRVGLPGDYAPFASEHDGALRGADIQLVSAFAAQERLQVRFVRTSWSTLLVDYSAGRFDIAAGGVSITPERSQVAAFSSSYYSGGKTAIVRCGEETKFDTLAEIDRPGVRVVVNPGGTNERFAHDRLKHADLVVHADNRTVFEEITARRADVMVTDDIEVDARTRMHGGLCRATSERFTQSEKAWLLPRDPALLVEVNTWLSQALRAGKVQQALTAAMQPEPAG